MVVIVWFPRVALSLRVLCWAVTNTVRGDTIVSAVAAVGEGDGLRRDRSRGTSGGAHLIAVSFDAAAAATKVAIVTPDSPEPAVPPAAASGALSGWSSMESLPALSRLASWHADEAEATTTTSPEVRVPAVVPAVIAVAAAATGATPATITVAPVGTSVTAGGVAGRAGGAISPQRLTSAAAESVAVSIDSDTAIVAPRSGIALAGNAITAAARPVRVRTMRAERKTAEMAIRDSGGASSTATTAETLPRRQRKSSLWGWPAAGLVGNSAPQPLPQCSFFINVVWFLVGILATALTSTSLLLRESAQIRMEALLRKGQACCKSVSASEAIGCNQGRLVHVQGCVLRAAAAVRDAQFEDAVILDGCVRLRSEVEVFQVIEVMKKRKGGSNASDSVPLYVEEWSQTWHKSERYKDKNQRGRNTNVAGVRLGVTVANCGRVELGVAFVLSDALVSQCNTFEPAAARLPPKLRLPGHDPRGGGMLTNGGEYFYYRRRDPMWNGWGAPMVGDVRVRFDYVPEGVATVLALQCFVDNSIHATFLPYRLLQRGWHTMGDAEEREALVREASKSTERLAWERQWDGMWGLSCCLCNVASLCLSEASSPEIFHLFSGDLSVAACFHEIWPRCTWGTWLLRLRDWALLSTGLFLVLTPIVPCPAFALLFGPQFLDREQLVVLVACFVTAFLVLSIVSLGYRSYVSDFSLLSIVGMTVFVVVCAIMLLVGVPRLQLQVWQN
eukprot:TRINITY_DN43684_c0_g1_i1.p1 TRINITY_DN43684_c0_g1~~TRINITY_DN43684_c0_g1_i1.p1  ORF type:complete len:761 (-),score=126.86 TRINITY_DN43684_c0_g1_i1:58-2247(-)